MTAGPDLKNHISPTIDTFFEPVSLFVLKIHHIGFSLFLRQTLAATGFQVCADKAFDNLLPVL